MGLALTSSCDSLVVVGTDATYTATAHGSGGLLYVKYIKGSEDGVRISLSYGSKFINPTERYQHISLNSATRVLSPTTYVLTASGNYRIPITWTVEEVNLTFGFSQYGAVAWDGSVDVDFREAE